MFIGVFLGCVIGQILLALCGVQTGREGFVGGFWQSSAIISCWLTMRAADWLVRRRINDDGSQPANR